MCLVGKGGLNLFKLFLNSQQVGRLGLNGPESEDLGVGRHRPHTRGCSGL